MKKLILLVVLVFLFTTMFAHQVAFLYALRDGNNFNNTDDTGFKLNFASFSWGDNDFSDYALSFSISELSPTFTTVNINNAWLKFPVRNDLEIRIGKQYHDFGNVSKTGSC